MMQKPKKSLYGLFVKAGLEPLKQVMEVMGSVVVVLGALG